MRFIVVAAAIALCLPEPACAHLVSTRFGELYSGLMHPVTALQHFVPWLALGFLGGLLGSDTSRWVLLVFPVSVAAGALLTAGVPGIGIIDGVNIVSFIALGLLVALAPSLSRSAFVVLTALVGLSHGYANGTSELSGMPLFLYVFGVMLAAYLLVAIVTAFAAYVVRQKSWGSIAVRAAGSWVFAIGLVYGGFTLLQPVPVG